MRDVGRLLLENKEEHIKFHIKAFSPQNWIGEKSKLMKFKIASNRHPLSKNFGGGAYFVH